jgi:DNA polymerase III epsilon subunit-like protein
MRVLIFDTETTGLPKVQKSVPKVENIGDWPHIVQMSWLYYDTESCQLMGESDNIIKLPEGIIISEESTNIHKITNQMCKTNGKKMSDVLDNFMEKFAEADLIVAHNMEFDHKMLQAESIRILMNYQEGQPGWESKLMQWQKIVYCKKLFCTMQQTVDLCNIQAISPKTGRTYIKFPTLAELHHFYFGCKPSNLHNALVDVIVCLRCFHILNFGKDICEDNIKIRRFVNNMLY